MAGLSWRSLAPLALQYRHRGNAPGSLRIAFVISILAVAKFDSDFSDSMFVAKKKTSPSDRSSHPTHQPTSG
jgi:hypothetical protein